MEKKQILSMLTMLKTAFPSYYKNFTKEEAEQVVDLFEMAFKDDDANEVFNALKKLILKSEFPPVIATIKKEIADNKMKDFPKAEDEWNKVLELCRKYGSYRIQEALDEMSAYTRYITGHIGFFNICMAEPEQLVWYKKDFINEYNSLKDQQKELIQIGHKEVNVLKLLQEHNENKKPE